MFHQLTDLPGVGAYTARAIQSFAFGKRVAAVDVNHARVVRRVFFGLRAVATKMIEKRAVTLSPERGHVEWNQAMMDFGALVCKAKPLCMQCPLRVECNAFPEILSEKKKSKRMVEPFLDSNRYFRGRIVEVLRKLPHQKAMHEYELLRLVQRYQKILPARFHTLVSDLERDGILTRFSNGRALTIKLS